MEAAFEKSATASLRLNYNIVLSMVGDQMGCVLLFTAVLQALVQAFCI